MWRSQSVNSGDDIAGTVASVGPGVRGIREGDRVAAFHIMMTSSGSFAEYAIAPDWLTFHIPEALSYEEAATIPLAAYTAAVALFHDLEFPAPWDSAAKKADKEDVRRPLVVYGASTAVGAYGIKLAKLANIHPVIAVGSKNSEFVTPFLTKDKGDRLVDYTASKTDAELVEAIRAAVKDAGAPDGRAFDAYDCVSEPNTIKLLSEAIAGPPDAHGRKPRLTTVLPGVKAETDESVDVLVTSVGTVHGTSEHEKLLGLTWGQAFSRGLAEGWFTPHPHEVAPGGLGGLEGALKGLKDGTVRGKKMVIRLCETEGVKA